MAESIVTNEDNMAMMSRYPDKSISDLQIGKAGEYLVCADLILNGHIAFLSEQGLPFDVVMEHSGKLIKVQVKTTRGAKFAPQRKTNIPVFIFHIGNNGKLNRRKKYKASQVDMFALVDLTSRSIAYLPFFNCQTTMIFRIPELRGKYHDEQGYQLKEAVMRMKASGLTIDEIVKNTGLRKSNVYKYSANVSIAQRATNSGVYFDEFTLEKCLLAL